MTKHLHPKRKGEQEVKARKTFSERKVRHQSRVEKLKAIPRVRMGRRLMTTGNRMRMLGHKRPFLHYC